MAYDSLTRKVVKKSVTNINYWFTDELKSIKKNIDFKFNNLMDNEEKKSKIKQLKYK